MKSLAYLAALGTLTLGASVASAQAQGSGIPVAKDARTSVSTPAVSSTSSGSIAYVGPLGYQLTPGAAPIYCRPGDEEEVAKVAIKSDLYTQGMITPEQAKALALCAVPGQISSGEMEARDGRTVYQITLLPEKKQTHSKVDIDAYTGEVVNATQFGGLRGLAGYLRESLERKENKAKAAQDSTSSRP